MDIPLETRKSLLTFGWLCSWSIREAKSTCSVFFGKINYRYKPELREISPGTVALCSPFLGWCPWGSAQAHDGWDTSKPQENPQLARHISWPLRTVCLTLCKAFCFKMRVRGKNKFQTLSLPVCKICSRWRALPAAGSSTLARVKAETLGSEHWCWFFSASHPVPSCCLAECWTVCSEPLIEILPPVQPSQRMCCVLAELVQLLVPKLLIRVTSSLRWLGCSCHYSRDASVIDDSLPCTRLNEAIFCHKNKKMKVKRTIIADTHFYCSDTSITAFCMSFYIWCG